MQEPLTPVLPIFFTSRLKDSVSPAPAHLVAVYAATKWAVAGLTESLRLEVQKMGKSGVKFSSIHPNFLKKGLFEGTKLNFLGQLLAPGVKSHDAVAKVIVTGNHHPLRIILQNFATTTCMTKRSSLSILRKKLLRQIPFLITIVILCLLTLVYARSVINIWCKTEVMEWFLKPLSLCT